MSKVGGMPLLAAIARVRGLIVAAGHPPSVLDPALALVEQFPEKMASAMLSQNHRWETCQDVFDDMEWAEKKLRTINPSLRLVAEQRTKASPLAATVDSATSDESAASDDLVAAVGKVTDGGPDRRACWACGQTGHIRRFCPELRKAHPAGGARVPG